MFPSRFTPCPECGASVDRVETVAHRCDAERQLDYRMFDLRDEIESLETSMRAHLDTPAGHFEVWSAAHQVRRGTD